MLKLYLTVKYNFIHEQISNDKTNLSGLHYIYQVVIIFIRSSLYMSGLYYRFYTWNLLISSWSQAEVCKNGENFIMIHDKKILVSNKLTLSKIGRKLCWSMYINFLWYKKLNYTCSCKVIAQDARWTDRSSQPKKCF